MMLDNKTTVRKLRGRPCKNPEDKHKKLTLSCYEETREQIRFCQNQDKMFSYSGVFRRAMNDEFKMAKMKQRIA